MSIDTEQLSTQPAPPPQRPAHQRPLATLRRGWRVLTSMRTALLLLTLLAAAAIPGSLIPQHSLAPSAVARFQQKHPTLAPIYAKFDLFDVFHAPWFAAIYALLFISLIGCVIPRIRLHVRALLRRPPAAPRNLARLPQSARWETDLPVDQVVAAAARTLRRRRFRVATDTTTLAAEKGYLRESGNLLFHVALLFLLVAIGVGSMFGYQGSKLLLDGSTFTNSNLLYDTYKPGALTSPSDLDPFQVTLHQFKATYQPDGSAATFNAYVTAKTASGQVSTHDLRVNHPLSFGHTNVYLIGHGYALHVVLRDAKGNIWHEETVPCIPQDLVNYLSQCVVKAPDTGAMTTRKVSDPQTGQTAEVPAPLQYGFLITFVPTAVITNLGVQSAFPAPDNPRAIVTAYTGNLGVNSGVPQSVYDLNTTGMTPLPIPLDKQFVTPGPSSAKIPLSQGFTLQITGYTQWASLQVKDDPAKGWALVAAILLISGLLLSLRVRRRRVWLRATPTAAGRTIVEAGGLARTDADDFAREFPTLVGRLAAEIRPAAREDPECPST
ncbi:MAG TPA: cytochrome c biogenesis protein ResB [Mycobacteriales bacterium]